MEARVSTNSIGMETITVYGSNGGSLGQSQLASRDAVIQGTSFYNNMYAFPYNYISYDTLVAGFVADTPEAEEKMEEIVVTGQRWVWDDDNDFDVSDFLAKIALRTAEGRVAGPRAALVAGIFGALEYLYNHAPVELEPKSDTELTPEQIEELQAYFAEHGHWPFSC